MNDVTGGGPYIDAALYATGISDEKLMQNLCSSLQSKINETEYSVVSKNWSARGRGRYLSWTGSISELAETPSKKDMEIKQS